MNSLLSAEPRATLLLTKNEGVALAHLSWQSANHSRLAPPLRATG
jgi:hypothetical protein